MHWYQRFTQLITEWIRSVRARLAQVIAVDVGKPADGLVLFQPAGTSLDKSWHELSEEFKDALTAWRQNPLARRLIGLTTAYVVGGTGVTFRSRNRRFNAFIKEFVDHPENVLMMRQPDWCDELSRSGELFPTLHTNSADGMSYVRVVPASRIEKIDWREGDYEAETAYHEVSSVIGEEGPVWYHPRAVPQETRNNDGNNDNNGKILPVMLHYAVNRPIGHVRGESDLAPILLWLKRYKGWLEDRVRLNAAMRVYLWIVKVTGHLVKDKKKQYESTPESGTVLVVDRDSEEWAAVTPSIKAADAEPDGRAIRKMIVAGGPGVSLLDMGEPETGNLASATEMGELRRRFLLRRQSYFGYVLADVVVHAWNRAVVLGLKKGKLVTLAEIEIGLPDIAPEDNVLLSQAAGQITEALERLQNVVGPSKAFRKLATRLLLKFAGETVSEEEFDEIIGGAFAGGEGAA